MENINKPSKEDIIEYYVNQNHSIKECAEHFQLSWDSMSRRIKKYNIIKDKKNKDITCDKLKQKRLEDLVKSVGTKEEIFCYYITENHTIKECQQYFNICKDTFLKVLRYYNIAKSCDGGIRDEKFLESQQNKWNPSYDELYSLYIINNLSEKNIAVHYNVSVSIVSKTLKKYNIQKNSKQLKENRKSTCLIKYGVDNPLQCLQVQKKSKETCKKKYGCEYALQSPEIQDKKNKTVFKKYGVINVGQNIDIRMLAMQTTFKKYGVENVFQSDIIKQKIKQTNLQKYGVENVKQKNIYHLEIWSNKEYFLKYLTSLKKKPTINELKQYFHVDSTAVLYKIHSWQFENFVDLLPNRSHYEDEIIEMLRKEFNITNIELNKRGLLPSGKEIDIYLPDYNVGIEFNGEYWHCDLHEKFQDHSGRSHYHQDKSLEAEEQGIFLFHIFEHEWDEMWTTKNSKFQNSHENIINRLSNILTQAKNHIPARKCEIREITKEQKKEFLNKNHIQGNEYTGSYILGLFYEDQLVSCMCFGHSKFTRYNYELTRFATTHDTVVQGGASKLFKYFVKNKMKEGEKIVSYNDITKTRGNIYKILGFECVSINEPNYWWVNFDTMDIRSRYQEQEAGEVERMHSQGYHRICDCGTRTWVYTKK